MKLKTFILISVVTFLVLFFEVKIENKLRIGNIFNEFKIKSLFIKYSYNKADGDKKKVTNFIKKYFLLYPELYFVTIKAKDKIEFAANKTSKYNSFFHAFLNTLMLDKKIKSTYIFNKERFYFIKIKNKDKQIITGFLFNLKLWKYWLRNFVLFLIVCGIMFLKYKFSGLKNLKYEREFLEQDDDKYNEEQGKEIYNASIESYKDLYRDNQKLIEEVENLSTFREIGLAINSITNFNQMLHVIMGVVLNKLGVKKIIIYFKDEEELELKARIGREGDRVLSSDELKEEKIILDNSVIGKAINMHIPIIVTTVESENQLITPLVAKGNLIGAIKVADKIENYVFKDEDKSFMKLLASQIAIGLNNARLYEMAITDGLTGLYVHRHFQNKLQEELCRHKRNGKNLSLVMIDIDHFKKFNDTYGHQTGDYVLKEIALLLKKTVRSTDSCFRYGGEEMAIILPETSSDSAYILGEKIRETVEYYTFSFNGNSFKVTISLGIATFDPRNSGIINKNKLIKMADDALYFSKENGRNKTTLYKDEIVKKDELTKINSNSLTPEILSEAQNFESLENLLKVETTKFNF